MSVKKVSMVIFVTGILLALFGAVFEIPLENKSMYVAGLVILGFFVGLLNISDEQMIEFLVACVAFLFSGYLFNEILASRFASIGPLVIMLENLIIFVIPATIAVSLKVILAHASESDKHLIQDFPLKEDRHVLLDVWDTVVLVSVAFVFVILILQSGLFQFSDAFSQGLSIVDNIILGIFVIDLIIIFKQSNSIKEFFMRNWLDILAVIPFATFLKIFRAVRLIKIFKAGSKVVKVNRGAKFFSSSSGFNRLVVPEDIKKSKKKSNPTKSKKKTTKSKKTSTRSKSKKSKK